jgi:hypothetical protein
MYPNLTPDLARARFNDRLARAEAQQLASATKQTRSERRRQRGRILAVPRLLPLRLMTRRPAA